MLKEDEIKHHHKDEKKKKDKKEKKHKHKKHKHKHDKDDKKHDKHEKKRKRSSSMSSSSVSSNASNNNSKNNNNIHITSNNDNKHRKTDNNNNNDNDNEKFAINEIKEITATSSLSTTTDGIIDITKGISLEGITKVVTKSKLDFFSSLIANELNAPQIGTIHAKGKVDDSKEKERNRGWICSKCDTSNATYNLQCSKCRSMRRMEATHRTER